MTKNRSTRSYRRLALMAVLLTALTACATIEMGRNFDLQAFSSRVERGKTTEAQVQQWLGSPNSTGIVIETNGDKYRQWTYFFGKGKLNRMKEAKLKILQIKFDRQGIVRGYNYSSEVE